MKEDTDSLLKEIERNPFLKTFEKFVLDNILVEETNLEKFVKNFQDSQHSEESTDMAILENQSENLKNLMKNPNSAKLEKVLITIAQKLYENEDTKEPKWPPVIYLYDETTGGVNGINIKNAYEN